MLKKLLLLLFLVTLVGVAKLFGQSVTFEYDISGNCVLKYKTVVLGPSFVKNNSDQQDNDSVKIDMQKSLFGERKIIIYPNPTKGILKIEVTGKALDSKGKYILTDLGGKPIISDTFESMLFHIDMTHLPAGGYFLTLIVENNKDIWKIIKE